MGLNKRGRQNIHAFLSFSPSIKNISNRATKPKKLNIQVDILRPVKEKPNGLRSAVLKTIWNTREGDGHLDRSISPES